MSPEEFWPLLVQRCQKRELGSRLERVLKLLESESLNERCGGLFALESLSREDLEVQGFVVDLLSAFIRRRAGSALGIAGNQAVHRVPGDVQAALTILGRRVTHSREERPLDLHGISLCEAYLPFSNFKGAFLYDCDLEGALLCGADFNGAWLWRTNMRRVNLDGADLRGADLSGVRHLTLEQVAEAHCDEETRLPQELRPVIGQGPRLSQSW